MSDTTTKTVDEILRDCDSPLPLQVIPNNMGINLCSVEALSWTRQDDGQLVSLSIHFQPRTAPIRAHNEEVAALKRELAEARVVHKITREEIIKTYDIGGVFVRRAVEAMTTRIAVRTAAPGGKDGAAVSRPFGVHPCEKCGRMIADGSRLCAKCKDGHD